MQANFNNFILWNSLSPQIPLNEFMTEQSSYFYRLPGRYLRTLVPLGRKITSSYRICCSNAGRLRCTILVRSSDWWILTGVTISRSAACGFQLNKVTTL